MVGIASNAFALLPLFFYGLLSKGAAAHLMHQVEILAMAAYFGPFAEAFWLSLFEHFDRQSLWAYYQAVRSAVFGPGLLWLGVLAFLMQSAEQGVLGDAENVFFAILYSGGAVTLQLMRLTLKEWAFASATESLGNKCHRQRENIFLTLTLP